MSLFPRSTANAERKSGRRERENKGRKKHLVWNAFSLTLLTQKKDANENKVAKASTETAAISFVNGGKIKFRKFSSCCEMSRSYLEEKVTIRVLVLSTTFGKNNHDVLIYGWMDYIVPRALCLILLVICAHFSTTGSKSILLSLFRPISSIYIEW